MSLDGLSCDLCSNIIQYCVSCGTIRTPLSTTCLGCVSGYYIDAAGTSCISCPATCLSCTSIVCDSCVSTFTLTTFGTCECDVTMGLFLDIRTNDCRPCVSFYSNCQTCITDVSTPLMVACTICDPGYFLDPSGSCINCPAYCLSCTSSVTCNTCNSGFMPDIISGNCVCVPGTYLNSGTCTSCSIALPGCIDCSSTVFCMVCDSTNAYLLIANTCVLCSSMFPFCLNCDPTACITCQPGYTLVLGVCKDCLTVLSNPGCLECSPTACTL